MAYEMHLDGRTIGLDIAGRRPHLALRIGDRSYAVDDLPGQDGAFEITVDGHRHRGYRYAAGHELHIRLFGRTHIVTLVDPMQKAAGGKAANEIRAEMPGVVVELRRAAGDPVEEGETILTIESMKLQMAIIAPFKGKVATLHVAANAAFERNSLLVSLTPDGADGPAA